MQTITLLAEELTIAQLPPDAPLPALSASGQIFALLRTPGEVSLICRAGDLPASVKQTPGWQALALQGPFPFGLTGILASVLTPLAAAGVGIFALSTYDTDYVLVQQTDLARAIPALREAGHRVLLAE